MTTAGAVRKQSPDGEWTSPKITDGIIMNTFVSRPVRFPLLIADISDKCGAIYKLGRLNKNFAATVFKAPDFAFNGRASTLTKHTNSLVSLV